MNIRKAAIRLVVLFGLVVATNTVAAATMRATTPTLQATTTSYLFKVVIAMPKMMWTPAEVKADHPKTGDVVLMGSMSGGMPMGDSERHLEVHIYRRASGETVVGAHPTITILDTSLRSAKAVAVPVAEMEGVDTGTADLYYGNNVTMVGGRSYTITVTLDGQRAVLETTAPM